MIRTPLAAFVVAVSLALAACGDGDVTKGTGQGTVVAIDAAKNEITLDHGEIPGLMGAMTMTFAVSDPKILEGLAQGRAVEFDLENQDGRYVVLAVRAK